MFEPLPTVQNILRGSFSAFGGIQLGRPQKIGLLGPPPPPCTHFRPQRPDRGIYTSKESIIFPQPYFQKEVILPQV